MDGLGPYFLLANSRKRDTLYYSGPGYPQSVFETELGVKCNAQKFHLRIDF